MAGCLSRLTQERVWCRWHSCFSSRTRSQRSQSGQHSWHLQLNSHYVKAFHLQLRNPSSCCLKTNRRERSWVPSAGRTGGCLPPSECPPERSMKVRCKHCPLSHVSYIPYGPYGMAANHCSTLKTIVAVPRYPTNTPSPPLPRFLHSGVVLPSCMLL